jgi:transposase
MLRRTRALLIRQQTMLANAFRAHLAEFGIVVAQDIRHEPFFLVILPARRRRTAAEFHVKA